MTRDDKKQVHNRLSSMVHRPILQMRAALKTSECRNEEIVAYLDGELDGPALSRLEEHLAACSHCAAELEAERRLWREVDGVLACDEGPEMPKNFAEVVAARAQSDMSGMREGRERRRAFRLCLMLAVISVLLLGGAAVREAVFTPLRIIWKGGGALLNFLGHALYDAGAGFAVISRGVGGHLVFESRLRGLLVLLLFASALFMLRRLIAGYHTRSESN